MGVFFSHFTECSHTNSIKIYDVKTKSSAEQNIMIVKLIPT